MFQLLFWYNTENVDKMFVENVAIRCSNCGKLTGNINISTGEYQESDKKIEIGCQNIAKDKKIV